MPHEPDESLPSFDDLLEAKRRIQGLVRRTPVVSDPRLDRALGCRLHGKCENLQSIGAFKIRGASNAILRLREAGIASDVATHSSGNHGAAVAAAARADGRQAIVVMPDNSVDAKVRNVRRFGGEVEFCAANQAARERGLQRLVEQGMVPIHPYDHPDIVCGQGTAAIELIQQRPALDVLLAPVGGGGLLAGCAIAARHLRPDIRIIGAEPAGAADAAESLHSGTRVLEMTPDTIADGLRATIGNLPFRIFRKHVDEILTVSEEAIVWGMELAWRHWEMLIEPSSATVIAAIVEHPDTFAGLQVGAIISGGNVDLHDFPQFAGQPGD